MRLKIDSTWDGAAIGPDEAVVLEIRRTEGGLRLALDAPFHGDPPPNVAPGPTWALWEHEVVELFILGSEERYTEIELGPHGHHLALRLEGRRNIVARELPLRFTANIQGDRWTGEAHLPFEFLPPGPHRGNATAIWGLGEGRRYLAAHPMPGPQPDFHRLDAWMPLSLP